MNVSSIVIGNATTVKVIVMTVIIIILYHILSFIYNIVKSLIVLNRNGIPLISIDYETLKSLFYVDTRSLFTHLMKNFKDGSGLHAWLTPVGKPFIVISDASILSQVIVENAQKLTKHHAFGILELYRKTDLQSGPAWKVVHRIASKFPVHDNELQQGLQEMLSKWIDSLKTMKDFSCFADYTRSYYWELVLFLVMGPASDAKERLKLRNLYSKSWIACIDALADSFAHMFSGFMWLPLPKVIRYRYLAWRLRSQILESIKKGNHKSFTVMSVISNEMSVEDQLEVAMEFMFTGASSVTSSLIFFIFEIAKDVKLQKLIRDEILKAVSLKESGNDWVNANEVNDCKILEASLREVLRLYSPIHIGRLTLEDIIVLDKKNQKIKISKGSDIFSNPWFFQRNPDNFPNPDQFDYTRFIDKPHNIKNYHPFSQGIRSCPGQRIAYAVLKLVVANILIKYDVSLSSTSSNEPEFEPNLMLPVTPRNIYLDFKQRL